MDKERILQRVRKLMSFTEGAATEGEIENAMRMAREMMTEYGIEDADLFEDDSPESISTVSAVKRAGFQSWEQWLATAIGRITDTFPTIHHSYENGKDRKEVQFTGFDADVAVARELYPAVIVSIRTLARVRLGKGWKHTHRSYAEGFVSGLNSQAKKWQREASEGNEIILRKDLAIKRFVEETMNVKTKRSSRHEARVDDGAYAQGRKDGSRVRLRGGLGAKNRKKVE